MQSIILGLGGGALILVTWRSATDALNLGEKVFHLKVEDVALYLSVCLSHCLSVCLSVCLTVFAPVSQCLCPTSCEPLQQTIFINTPHPLSDIHTRMHAHTLSHTHTHICTHKH